MKFKDLWMLVRKCCDFFCNNTEKSVSQTGLNMNGSSHVEGGIHIHEIRNAYGVEHQTDGEKDE